MTTTAAPTSRPAWKRLPLLSALAWLAVAVAIPLVLAAWLWRDSLAECRGILLTLHYLAFMAQTFAYHAGLAMLAIIPLALFTRRRRLLIAAAAVFVLGAGPDLLTLLPKRAPSIAPGALALKVMSVNLMYGRGDHEALLAQIAAEAPDVVMFQEWTPGGSKALRATLKRVYPHDIESPRDDALGQAVFSRSAFLSPPRIYPPGRGFDVPQITCAIDLDGAPLAITTVHVLPPTGRNAFAGQRAMAGALAAWCANASDASRPDVLIGDFNAVRGSSIIHAFGVAGMSPAHDQSGFWRGSTWPRVGALRSVPGIRLDHALLRDTVVCTESRTGEDFGSDHCPVIVKIARKHAAP